MRISVKHLVKFLPMDDKVRQETLAKLDSYKPDQKKALEEFCWAMFYELLNTNVKYELDKAVLEIRDGNKDLDRNLYRKIEDQVYARFMRDIREEEESETIDEIRKKFRSMISTKVADTALANKS